MGRLSAYRLKKAIALYPGLVAPVSADFLSDHYDARRRSRSYSRAATDALAGALFRWWVPIRARRVARRYGLGTDWAREASRIARERFADPNDLALFRVQRPEELGTFMRRFEYAGISKRINPSCWRRDCALADKRLFYARCEAHGLPHPPVLANIERRRASVRRTPAAGMLAMKPVDGEGGSGFRLLDWAGGDAGEFKAFLQEQPRLGRTRWIVQTKVGPHADLQPIALSALPTARITTMKDEDGTPELVTSVLRFPSDPEALVDNIKAGGLMAPIDLATGVLGGACRGKSAGEVTEHPVTGAPVTGLTLPDWEQATALVLRAHSEAFPEYSMIGWDLALTPDGPTLIEGNGKPCIVVAQRATGRGIGETRFGALIRHHLAIADARH